MRQSDWTGRPELTTALESLKAIKAEVTVVQLIQDAHANVSIEQLTADSLTIARGVPWRIHLRVRNHGSAVTEGLRGTVRIDGNALPTSLLLPDIEPGKAVDVSQDLVLNSEGRNQVEVILDEDALPEDSRRFIAVDVTDRRAPFWWSMMNRFRKTLVLFPLPLVQTRTDRSRHGDTNVSGNRVDGFDGL